MKKQITLIFAVVVFSFCYFQEIKAQDTLSIKGGFFFCPQGVFNLKDIRHGTSTITPFFAVVSILKGNSLMNVMYNMSANNFQVVLWHQAFSTSSGVYLVSNKNILKNDYYSGIGITKTVAEGKVNAFIEFGSSWNAWTPSIYAGVIIPLMEKIK